MEHDEHDLGHDERMDCILKQGTTISGSFQKYRMWHQFSNVGRCYTNKQVRNGSFLLQSTVQLRCKKNLESVSDSFLVDAAKITCYPNEVLYTKRGTKGSSILPSQTKKFATRKCSMPGVKSVLRNHRFMKLFGLLNVSPRVSNNCMNFQ